MVHRLRHGPALPLRGTHSGQSPRPVHSAYRRCSHWQPAHRLVAPSGAETRGDDRPTLKLGAGRLHCRPGTPGLSVMLRSDPHLGRGSRTMPSLHRSSSTKLKPQDQMICRDMNKPNGPKGGRITCLYSVGHLRMPGDNPSLLPLDTPCAARRGTDRAALISQPRWIVKLNYALCQRSCVVRIGDPSFGGQNHQLGYIGH